MNIPAQTSVSLGGLASSDPEPVAQPTKRLLEPPPSWYPGKYEDKDREAKDITGTNEFHDGLKLEITRALSNNFSTSHSFSMAGSEGNSAYAFNATYGTNKFNALGRYDDGRVIGRAAYNPTQNITVAAQTHISMEPPASMLTLEMDYKGSDSHMQVKADKGSFILSYMQSIWRSLTLRGVSLGNVALGTDLTHYPAQGTALTLGARYASSTDDRPPHIGTLSLSTLGSFNATYMRRVGKKAEFATEYLVGRGNDGVVHDTWMVGYQYNFRNSRLKARGDSNWRVGVVVEEAVAPFLRMNLYGDLDYKEQKYKLGLGFAMFM